MSKDDLTFINKTSGNDVIRCLKNIKKKGKQTSQGLYVLPSPNILIEYSKLATRADAESQDRKTKNKLKRPSSAESAITQDFWTIPENFKRIVNIGPNTNESRQSQSRRSKKSEKGRLKKKPSPFGNVSVHFENLFKNYHKTPELSFRRNKKPGVVWDFERMFRRIMMTNVGLVKDIQYEECLPEVLPILEEFHRKHNKFKYFTLLETVLEKTGQNKTPHVSVPQLQEYFYYVFIYVVPRSLFGNCRNVKKVRAGLKQYFLAPWGEAICLKDQILKMNIKCISWMRNIKNEETKWLILAKVVKWLFEEYLVPIFKIVFNVRKHLHNEAKIFLSSVRWKRSIRNYLKNQQRKSSIIKKCFVSHIPEKNLMPRGTMRLYPKKNGLRSIYKICFEQNAKDEISLLKTLLQQIFRRKFDPTSMKKLHSEWLSRIKSLKDDPTKKIYLVSSDITDAYGSIIQQKLYDIIYNFINEIPHDPLPIDTLAIFKTNKVRKKNTVVYKSWFSFCETFPFIKQGSIIALIEKTSDEKQYISKEKICTLLRALIFQQTFVFRGTEYVLKRGVPQGSPLSPILSEIYYAHMMSENLEISSNSDLLARYVDDFLYITFEEESAKRFLTKVKHGVPEFNCRFTSSKTQTNVESGFSEVSQSVTYLGYRFDTTTLEVHPVYNDVKSFRYFKSFQRITCKNEISIFAERILNFSSLKLCPIVLDTRINGSAIFSIANSAARAMAFRCVILISKSFDKYECYGYRIWDAIRYALNVLLSIFIRYVSGYEDNERRSVIRRIKKTIWQSFCKVFTTNKDFRLYYASEIRGLFSNQLNF